MTFRQSARDSLARAKAELASDVTERLKYAALELRYAMEAITYDRALAFKAEIPPEEYRTWQPRKLLQVLHAIDPKIGMTSSIAYGLQQESGKLAPGDKMQSLGTDTVLTLSDLRTHYDAIGSALHMSSLKQIEESKTTNPEWLRTRCLTIAAILERVLASRIWNSTLGVFAEIVCMRCEKPVRKRIPLGTEKLEATCFECGAGYTVEDVGEAKSLWKPKQQELPCPTKHCDAKIVIWDDEIKVGTCWTCPKCSVRYVIDLAVRPDETS